MAGMFGFKIIRQFQRGVVFRWGRALPGIREPGLTWINPVTDRLRKVNMQITVAAVPGQETITRDNVTMRVDAVVYYRVVDAVKAIVNVQDYKFAVAQVAQTSLRSVTGRSEVWATCCPSVRRTTPYSRTSSTSRPSNRGVSGWSGSRSRTCPCPRR